MILILILAIVVLLYVACGVLAYGLTLAYSQQHYYEIRRASDRGHALFMACFGPIGLGVVLIECEGAYHGFQWRATDSSGSLVAYDADRLHQRKH